MQERTRGVSSIRTYLLHKELRLESFTGTTAVSDKKKKKLPLVSHAHRCSQLNQCPRLPLEESMGVRVCSC